MSLQESSFRFNLNVSDIGANGSTGSLLADTVKKYNPDSTTDKNISLITGLSVTTYLQSRGSP